MPTTSSPRSAEPTGQRRGARAASQPRRRARPMPMSTPRDMGSRARRPCRPRVEAKARMPKMSSKRNAREAAWTSRRPSSMPAMLPRATAAMAQRVRPRTPPRMPARSASAMTSRASALVTGPRGANCAVSQPMTPAMPADASSPGTLTVRSCHAPPSSRGTAGCRRHALRSLHHLASASGLMRPCGASVAQVLIGLPCPGDADHRERVSRSRDVCRAGAPWRHEHGGRRRRTGLLGCREAAP